MEVGEREETTRSTQAVDAIRVSTDSQRPVEELCRVVVEQPITVAIDGVGNYTIMCTPCDAVALAVGFAFSEGIISSLRDINLLRRCENDPLTIRIQLAAVPETLPDRNLIVTSSCGMCGRTNVEEILAGLRRCPDSLRVPASVLQDVLRKMKSHQRIFSETGGAHAAAIFTADGEIIAFAEDIGRHSALDKAIGKCVLEEKPTEGCGAALSGRVSLELVAKAARAGIELVAAVSAPSSIAVEAAKRCGITLCGFVRENRATIYSHGSRIKELD